LIPWTIAASSPRMSRRRSSITWCASSSAQRLHSSNLVINKKRAGACSLFVYYEELLSYIPQQRARNHHALNLIRPLENLCHLHIAHIAFDGVIAHVACATENLNGVGCDLHRGIGGETLRHRSVHA